jgi:hypothetical protein
VNRDEEGAEAFGEDPFGIELGEPGQRGEVPVQEREPIVVILHVQTPSHALGQLVDEAEGAVVVAGPYAVEHRGGHLDPEGLARLFVDADEARQRCAGAFDHDAEVVGVGQLLEIDDVARLLPVEGEQLIAHGQAGAGCRRRLGDRSHRGSGHDAQVSARGAEGWSGVAEGGPGRPGGSGGLREPARRLLHNK